MKAPGTAPTIKDINNPLGLKLTDGQWEFIIKYYPVCGLAPHAMINWLFG